MGLGFKEWRVWGLVSCTFVLGALDELWASPKPETLIPTPLNPKPFMLRLQARGIRPASYGLGEASIIGVLKGNTRSFDSGSYRVYSGYIRIPGLRAHTRGSWFQPSKLLLQ